MCCKRNRQAARRTSNSYAQISATSTDIRKKVERQLCSKFSNEYKHVNKGRTVAFIDEIMEFSNELSYSPIVQNLLQGTKLLTQLSRSIWAFRNKQEQLKALLLQYKDCFLSSSKICEIPVAKHHIVAEEARPLWQSPYRVWTRKCEVVKRQVDKMLPDDIIQPSKSPWASSAVLQKRRTKPYVSVSIIAAST